MRYGWRTVLRWTLAATTAAALVVLTLVAAGQQQRIDQLRREATGRREAAETVAAATEQRLAGLDKRAKDSEARLAALDERNKNTLDPQAVAASALPSVFLVIAGDFSGSAFAVGRPEPGRTPILSAYHVVEPDWAKGGITVRLERDGKNYTATIADVSPTHDIALLTVSAKINGITAARTTPVSGEHHEGHDADDDEVHF